MTFYVRNCSNVVIGGSFNKYGNTMRAITLVQNFFVVGGVFAGSAFDGCFYPVFGHTYAAGILETATKGRIGGWVGTSGFNGYHDFLPDAGKLLRHAVPTGKHGGFSNFKYATHEMSFIFPRNFGNCKIKLCDLCYQPIAKGKADPCSESALNRIARLFLFF
jgi:hypothetical protein